MLFNNIIGRRCCAEHEINDSRYKKNRQNNFLNLDLKSQSLNLIS